MSRPVATSTDLSRQDATSDDYISIKEARVIFISNDRAVTERTLQRYCDKHYLDGKKRVTAEGEKWFVLKSSVLTRIAELEEFDKLRPAATAADTSLPVVEEIKRDDTHDMQRHISAENMSAPVASAEQSHATSTDQSRLAAASRDTSNAHETSTRDDASTLSPRERELLEREIEHLKSVSDLKQRIIERYEVENGGLREDKEKLYSLLDNANLEKRMLIEGDRDSKAVMKNNNSLIAYLSQLFKGKGELAAPPSVTSYQTPNISDMLAGDERVS